MMPRLRRMGESGLLAKRRRSKGLFSHIRLGTLSIIAATFLLSGVARAIEHGVLNASLGWPVIAAWAEETDKANAAEPNQEPDGAERLAIALTAREKDLTEREQQLQARELALELARAELDEAIARFEEVEEALRSTVALAETAAQSDLDQLTRMYETMNQKEAAALFETMDASFAAGFLGQMNPASAAEILSGLEPETAYQISLILAGRNVDTTTN